MNKKISTQPYKGARDFYPEDMAFRKWLFKKWRLVIERYGYVEYDAPILEPTDLYLMKGSEEIVREQTYTFEDRGGRSVTLRTEMTPTVSRMVAGRRQELPYPLRWYSFPNLWRYERMQKGRLREFWQPNVDLFGVDNVYGELEIIQIADELVQTFKAKRSSYTINIASRKLVNALFDSCNIPSKDHVSIVRLVDKIKKIPVEAFAEQLDAITGSKTVSSKIVSFLAANNVESIPEELKKGQTYQDLCILFDELASLGITNAVFDPTIMRGFDYYTDIVFEMFDTNPDNARSMMGGGRYDGLVAQFGVEPVPTVGFAWGDVVFTEFLKENNLIPAIKMACDVVVVVKNAESISNARSIARQLREMDVNTSIDFSGRKVDKQLKSAVKSGVRFVVFADAAQEVEGTYSLKDIKTQKESLHSLQRIVSIVKDYRL